MSVFIYPFTAKTHRQSDRFLFLFINITDITMIYDDEGDSIKAYQAAIM